MKSWIEPRQRENFKHFLSLNPPVGDLANLHDKALFELLQACSDYSEALVKSARFRELYKESVSPDSLKQLGAASPQEFFGAYPTEDHLALLAEKVINNVGDLPSYHTVARLWNQRRDVFLASREWPEITKRHQRTLKAGRNLREAAERLREFLEERRLELSLEYDVPPVSVRQLVENEGFPE